MARFAVGLLIISVCSGEWKITLCVVKGVLVNLSDILTAPLVLGMAFLTFPLLFQPSVIASFLPDIGPNIFMAVLTKSRLSRLVESFMTFGAILFPFGVALNDLAWHESGFNRVGECGGWEKTGEAEGKEEKRVVARRTHENGSIHHEV